MDNLFKSNHGNNSKNQLNEWINILKSRKLISSYKCNVKCGYHNQYHFQYILEFPDNEKWLVHSTTSIREDRIKIKQWDAYGLKKNIKGIKRVIVVYPDSISENERLRAQSYNRTIHKPLYDSEIDEVISFRELVDEIEHKGSNTKNKGRALSNRGNNFEIDMVNSLNYQDNWKVWNDSTSYKTGFYYDLFEEILSGVGIHRDDIILNVNATRKIPKLPSGGNPKTDIYFHVETSKTEKDFTISCKKTNSNWVSVHEYSYEDFVNALEIKDIQLVRALECFQKTGGKKKMKNEYPAEYEYLDKNMSHYNNNLAKWVYGGHGGNISNTIQLANYLISYNPQKSGCSFQVYNIDDYVEKITYNEHFGTPFRWTYPSKRLGEKIQLKGKV